MSENPIRVSTVIENSTATGPARILIEFARHAATPIGNSPAVAVTLVTYHRGTGQNLLQAAGEKAGLRVVCIPEHGRFDTSVLAGLRQVIESQAPDILETRNVKSHFLVRLLGLHKRYPWVAWNHGYTATSRMDRAYNFLDRWSMRGAFRVVTVCGPFADRLVQQGVKRENITILHNFVEPWPLVEASRLAAERERLGLRGDELLVLSAGRLSFEKGHADLLRAIALLTQDSSLPKFRVVLVGDGPERAGLERLAAELCITDRVVFAGFQREMAPYFAMADAMALPSHSEGSPNVLLEAMAAGLPVVATAVGGVPEILRDRQTGIMVPARTPQKMASALAEVLGNASLREQLGRAARAEVTTQYTRACYQEQLSRFYQETLQAYRSR